MILGSWVTCASFLLIMWISSHWSKYKAAGIAFPCLLCPNLCLQLVFCGPGLRHIPQILPHLACATHGPVRWDNELEKLAGATGGDAMPSHFTSKPKTPPLYMVTSFQGNVVEAAHHTLFLPWPHCIYVWRERYLTILPWSNTTWMILTTWVTYPPQLMMWRQQLQSSGSTIWKPKPNHLHLKRYNQQTITYTFKAENSISWWCLENQLLLIEPKWHYRHNNICLGCERWHSDACHFITACGSS